MRSGRIGRVCGGLLLSLLLTAASAPQLRGQTADTAAIRASPSLPQDHWALDALTRLEALGLIPAHLSPARTVSRTDALRLLTDGAAAAEQRDPSLAPTARRWVARFRGEFPDAPRAESRPGWVPWTQLSLGYAGGSAASRAAGDTTARARLERSDRAGDGASVGAALAAYPMPALALFAAPGLRPDGLHVERWSVVGLIGPVELSLGREPVGYGRAGEGAVLFSGASPLTRLQLRSARPLPLPLGLGRIALHGFVGRLNEPRHEGDPWIWGAAGLAQPHPRLTLGFQRGVIFGSGTGPVGITPRSVARMLVGVTTNGFDNQLASATLRFRVPSEGILPVTAYAEWGADDTAGAFWDSPGIVAGMLLPSLPGVPRATLGAEYAYFGNRCVVCRRVDDPVHWYSHFTLRGGWVAGGEPLGHSLGGNGTELRAYARADLGEGRASLSGDWFHRGRPPENLYAPTWAGSSSGLRLGGRIALAPGRSAQLHWEREQGSAWRVQRLQAFFTAAL